MVNPTLLEILVRWLRRSEEILANASSQTSSVGQREQIKHGLDGWIHVDSTGWQHAVSRIQIGNRCDARGPKAVDQGLECAEEERLFFPDWSAQDSAELVAFERWNRLICRIEEVFRIERRVSEELEDGTVILVRAGPCDCVDNASCGTPEFR